MKKIELTTVFGLAWAAGASALVVGCGGSSSGRVPGADLSSPSTSAVSASALGGFSFKCGKGTSQQQQQQFQRQKSCVSQGPKQVIQFKGSKVSDFNVHLDCANRMVVAEALDGGKNIQLPIQQDGSVKGGVEFPTEVQSDGKGNQQCFIDYVVAFDGVADCDDDASSRHSLSMKTMVDFTEAAALPNDDALNPDRNQDQDQDQDHDQDQGHDWGHHEPTPPARPVLIPRKRCIVENPCPVVTKTDFSCPEDSGTPAPAPLPEPAPGPVPHYPNPTPLPTPAP